MAKKAGQAAAVVAADVPATGASAPAPEHAKDANDVLLVAIRIRGDVKKNIDIKKTMGLLRLHHKHHAALVRASPAINGMLFKCKDTIAYGVIDKETLVALLKKKAKLTGRRVLDEASLKNLTGHASYEALADALLKGEVKYHELHKQIVPIFRLHPARGGFDKGIKVSYQQGGVLGYQGSGINKLLARMI
ncbi:MAG: 50S ribosomal protein L30 [Candidatus Lokiarchaeota archaeon]|nr:50S ribosomal protein L30 [Candidatus Lokiarchaeota archaeon]